jgi:hypothetical protein
METRLMILPTNNPGPIDFPTLPEDVTECGAGGERRLSVDFDVGSILRDDDPSRIDLDEREWSYGFIEPGDEVLRLVFAVQSSTPVVGYAVPVNEKNTCTEPPVALAQENGAWVYLCPRPAETSPEPRIQIFFDVQPPRVRSGMLPLPPKPILPPCEAQPRMILKPKRNCPTSGSSGPPTMDD